MSNPSRRDFLRRGSLGIASLGVGGLVLRPDAPPTETSCGGGDLPPDLELNLEYNPIFMRCSCIET